MGEGVKFKLFPGKKKIQKNKIHILTDLFEKKYKCPNTVEKYNLTFFKKLSTIACYLKDYSSHNAKAHKVKTYHAFRSTYHSDHILILP